MTKKFEDKIKELKSGKPVEVSGKEHAAFIKGIEKSMKKKKESE